MKHKDANSLVRALEKRLQLVKLNKAHVVVGMVKNKKQERNEGGTISNAALAAIHEYGTDEIPSRPFLRPAFYENEKKSMDILFKAFRKAIVDANAEVFYKYLGIVGAQLKSEIFNKITQGPPLQPPNAPSTIRRKGSSRPLVDTGQMARSVSWEVRKK